MIKVRSIDKVPEDKHYLDYRTKEDDLLIFSKISGRLYGFDQFGTSLFSFLEERKGSKEELLQHAGDNKDVHSLIHTISNLLNGQEEPEQPIEDFLVLEYPPISVHTDYKNPFYYKLDTFIFVIDTENKFIIEKILPALSHMQCEEYASNKISIHISFMHKEDKWSICLNEAVVHRELELIELLPRLLDCIRIAYYRSTDYLISLHSGALYFNKIPLILPAASGSGKSTLSTYLMYQKNFEFLTDEVVMIDKHSCIYPIPMAITIKEGSWKALESYGIPLNNLSIHKRFDGQLLRFLPPHQIATEHLKVNGAYLVFPQYAAEAVTKIKPLSTLEALSIITTSGYEVFDSYDEATVKQWIDILENLKKYTITYSNMEDARQHIERLMTS